MTPDTIEQSSFSIQSIQETLARLHTALSSMAESGGCRRVKIGDLEIETDVRQLTSLIRYYTELLNQMQNRQTMIKKLDLRNAF